MTGDVVSRLTDQDRARLRKLITNYSGLGEAIQSDSALEQAVAQRLAAHRLDSFATYWALLQRGAVRNSEMNNLVQLITNKETFFFRERHHFSVLNNQVLPDLFAGGKQMLRVWSAGCATGEEPYSLAIALLEYQARHGSFAAEVIGTDIDVRALEQARKGCYGRRAVRNVSEALLKKHFLFDGQIYCVAPEVAELVRFEVYNLAEDYHPLDLVNLDIVFCRNVTIYFDDAARDRLNARLAASLREGGYLFVASAETMGHNRGRLELVSTENTFLFRRRRSPTAPQAPAPKPELELPSSRLARFTSTRPQVSPRLVSAAPVSAPEPLPPPSSSWLQGPSGRASTADPHLDSVTVLKRAYSAFQEQAYDAAMLELERLPHDPPVWLEAYCLRAAILLQQSHLDEAESMCQTVLAHDLWHADAHFLLGLILRQQGQAEAAVQSLKQAIYLQPTHRHAHFFLAETYRDLGAPEEARSEYDNTLNILRHRPEQMSDLNLAGLADDTLQQACLVNLKRLGGRLKPSLSRRRQT
jgi:chemotaxis protein methyltransferase CheR